MSKNPPSSIRLLPCGGPLLALLCLATAPTGAAAQTPAWASAHVLSGRYQGAMVYDPARQRLLLQGGRLLLGWTTYDETWEWDGTSWQHRLPRTCPPRVPTRAMACDLARHRTVLFLGDTAGPQTWEWDGSTWALRTVTTGPSTRQNTAITYDEVRQRTVLFGGSDSSTVGLLGDTWEWDGTSWLRRTPLQSPPAQAEHCMTFDPVRQRVLLVGQGATWEWDGSNWVQRPAAQTPTGLAALTYDRARQRAVLFLEASPPQTWEWNGSVWQRQNPLTSPPSRSYAMMAYDGARQRTVLFGGRPSSGGTPALADMWTWDGTTWTRLGTDAEPPARVDAAMTEDVARSGVLLFGGLNYSGAGLLGDTWEWDGFRWQQWSPALTPPARRGHAMAGDWFSARVVLFGGFGSTGALNDTWEWDGTGWTQHTTTQQPRAGSHAMAWDPVGGGTLLFGAGSSGPETWKWNGATWTRILPAHTPSARAAHAMATDLRRRCVVLYGGNDGVSNLGDTWEWNGTDWIQATPAVNPNVRAYHAMAYLPSRSRVVLFGGANAATGTWEWDGTQWTLSPSTWPAGEVVPRRRHCLALEPDRGTVLLTGGQFDSSSTSMAQGTLRYGPLTTAATSLLGAGCGGPNGAPVLTAGEPYLGCPNAAIQISAAPPHAIGVLGLSFVAERLHLDGRCTLYLGTLAAIRVLSTDAAGSAVCPLAVPATPSLRGIAFHAQAAVSDPQGPVAGWSLTAARTMVVGD